MKKSDFNHYVNLLVDDESNNIGVEVLSSGDSVIVHWLFSLRTLFFYIALLVIPIIGVIYESSAISYEAIGISLLWFLLLYKHIKSTFFSGVLSTFDTEAKEVRVQRKNIKNHGYEIFNFGEVERIYSESYMLLLPRINSERLFLQRKNGSKIILAELSSTSFSNSISRLLNKLVKSK